MIMQFPDNTPYSDYKEFEQLNNLLSEAGKFAQSLTNKGYTVRMDLWDKDVGGRIVEGRLQGNVSKAFLFK